MINPYFSIIIPTYNREKTIEKAISSCLNQSFQDFEVIVIDDCSTDSTVNIVDKIDDSRVKLFKNRENSERCISRNNGIHHSTGKYICFLDSDDWFLDNHLQIFHEFINANDEPVGLLFTNSVIENEQGERTDKIVPKFDESNKYGYLLKYTPNPARVCVHHSILNEFQFDPRIPGMEDLDLWLRISSKYKVFHIEEITNVYYVHSESYTDGDEKRFTKELSYHPIIENQPELKGKLPKKAMNRLRSMCYFHLATKAIEKGNRKSFYSHAIKSLWYFPKGYNGKTNKILFVNCIYFIPGIGTMIRKIKQRK